MAMAQEVFVPFVEHYKPKPSHMNGMLNPHELAGMVGVAKEIRISPEHIEEEARNLRNCKSEHDNSLAEMEYLINGLIEYWRGEAQDAFVTSFRNKKKAFEEFSSNLEDFARYLETFAMVMRDHEKLQAGIASQL